MSSSRPTPSARFSIYPIAASISSTIMCFGISSSLRFARTSLSMSSLSPCSLSISVSTVKDTRSSGLMSSTGKSTNAPSGTIPFVRTTTSRSLLMMVTRFTPKFSSSVARSRLSTSPGSATISPVDGSMTGCASSCPDIRVARASFLLYL